jgi:hypothetical protein
MIVRVKSLLVLVLLAAGCTCQSSGSGTQASASAAPSAGPTPLFRIPTGPRFAVIAGKGIGPIRMGATLATVERHMELACPDKSDTVCRYVDRGVEFRFANGTVNRILIHRGDRKAPDGKVWGVFNGGIPPDLRFGMLIPAIQQFLGPPKKVVQGNAGADVETSEQHYYEGMVLEYDTTPNGQQILGAIRIPE